MGVSIWGVMRGCVVGPIILPESWSNRPRKARTVAFEKRLCDLLGLVHPDALQDGGPVLQAGWVAAASSLDLVEKITGEWLKEKRATIKRQVAAGEWDDLTDADLPAPIFDLHTFSTEDRLLFAVLFLTYRQYLHNVTKKAYRHGPNVNWDHDHKARPKKHVWWEFRPLDMRYLIAKGGAPDAPPPEEWTPDLAGYLAYLRAVNPGMFAFLSRAVPALLPASALLRHTYITGAIGSGKTELLKLVVHGLVAANNCAVVVLDPHGDMAEQIARWPEFAPGGAAHGRLVYVDPLLDPDYSPCLNPFDLGGRKATGADTQQFIEALSEVLGDGGGASFTVPMRNILLHTVPVLMGEKGRSPADLVRFLKAGENVDLIEAARRKLPPDDAAFFSGEFQAAQYQQTRLAITTKLRVMLGAGRSLFVGPSTVNLESLIEDRKVIVFNLAKGPLGAASDALGRFVLANLLALALRRAGTNRRGRVPAHVLVDECHTYLGPSIEQILTDARKFGLALTLCQQQVGQGMGPDLSRSVIGNPQLKLTGTNEIASHKAIAASTGTPLETFQGLRDRQFVVTRGGGRNKPLPFVLDAASHLADESRAMTPGEWTTVKAEQLAAYYRPLKAIPGAGPEGDEPGPDAGTPKPKFDL